MDFRALDVQRIIDEDPWTITVYRRGETFDDPERAFSFVGTIHPQGSRGVPLILFAAAAGEAPVARYAWVVLAPQGTQPMKNQDELRALQQAGTEQRVFTVSYSARYVYKQEAIAEERQ